VSTKPTNSSASSSTKFSSTTNSLVATDSSSKNKAKVDKPKKTQVADTSTSNNIEVNDNASTHDQIQAGNAAALRVAQQKEQLAASKTASSAIVGATSSTGPSSSSSHSSFTSSDVDNVGPKTKSKLLANSVRTTGSIGDTLNSAMERSRLEDEAKARHARGQEVLLQQMTATMNARTNRINGVNVNSNSSTSGSTHSSSNSSYHTTAEDEEPNHSCISTNLSDNNSMLKSNTCPVRILNPNGKDSSAHCFLEADLLVPASLKHQLVNQVSRFAGHPTRRPPQVGLCYVYVVNDKGVIELKCIEEHIEIITQVVYAEGCEKGILKNHGVWNTVKLNLADKNSDWKFKNIISVTLATSIINSPYMKEWHSKWYNQISSIGVTMKNNYNASAEGK